MAQNKYLTSFLYIMLISFSGCGTNRTITSAPAPPVAPVNTEVVAAGYMNARVKNFTGLDGCSYVIELEGGKILVPENLDPSFQQDDLAVYVKYKIKKGATGICMAGTIVEITGIKIKTRSAK